MKFKRARVREYVLDSAGAVKKLAIDFVQNCEVQGPPLYGVVRINSSIALAVPDSAAIAGRDFSVTDGQTATLDGTKSFSRHHAPMTYLWTQIDGPSVTLDNPNSATPSFVAPAVDVGGATVHFRLFATNAIGDVASDDVIVVVQSHDAPRTTADFSGDAGDFITGGKAFHFDTQNANIAFSRNFSGGVSASITGDTSWTVDTAVAAGKTYGKGVHKNAQRFPFQAGTPGLSLSGDGRGCNTLTGQFTVYQIQFDPAGNPTVADIGFTQRCEGGSSAATGELLLNAVPHATLARQLSEARRQFPRR